MRKAYPVQLYNTCILPIFLYGSKCWAVTKRDVLKIDALDQWCLQKLLGIKWYHHVRNDEVRRTTGQPRLSAIVQARRLSLFGYIARMPDETDARSIITASSSENWRRPPGRPRTTWMKTQILHYSFKPELGLELESNPEHKVTLELCLKCIS